MAIDDKISRVLLKFETDRASLSQASMSLAKVRGEMNYVAQTAKQVDLATVKAGESIKTAFSSQGSPRLLSQLARTTEDATKQMNRLKESVTGVQSEIRQLPKLKASDIVEPELNEVLGIKTFGSKVREGQTSLRKFGALGRSLPSTQIPGLGGVGTDAISNIVRLIGSVPPQLLAVGAALIPVAIAFKFAADAATLAGEKEKQRGEILAEVTRAVLEGTKAELQAKRDAAAVESAIQVVILQQRIARLRELEDKANDVDILIGKDQREGLTALGLINGDLKVARDQVIETSTALTKSQETEAAYDAALTQGLTAKNDTKAAEEALTEARRKDSERGIQYILDQSKFEQEAAKFTVEQNKARVKSVEDQLAIITQEIVLRQKNGDTSKENADRLSELSIQYAQLSTQTDFLTHSGLELAKANDLVAETDKKRVDSIKATEKYNQDVLKINQDAVAREIDLATKYADNLVSIAAKAVEDAEKLLTQLEQKLADLATDVGRDLDKDTRKANFEALQEQIEFQQDEVNETKKHYQDIERIRRQARAAEFEQGLDRDFAGLARSRRATAEQISEQTIQFNEDRQARLDGFAAKRSDDAAEFAFERAERILQFEQDVADARANYIRERIQLADAKNKQLLQARAAYDKELALLKSKTNAELAIRDAGIRTELQMIQAGNTARIQLEQQLQAQYIAILTNAIGSVGGNLTSGSTSGAGFTTLPGGTGGVNAGGTIGNIGGIFGVGASASRGTTNKNSMSLSVPIQITTGASPEQIRAIAPAIGNILEQKLTEYHRSVYGS